MTIKETIEKTIKGGMLGKDVVVKSIEKQEFQFTDAYVVKVESGETYYIILEQWLLRPDFFQSLGKSLGWYRVDHRTGFNTRPVNEHTKCTRFCKTSPLSYWHNLINHLYLGGTPESYFKEL